MGEQIMIASTDHLPSTTPPMKPPMKPAASGGAGPVASNSTTPPTTLLNPNASAIGGIETPVAPNPTSSPIPTEPSPPNNSAFWGGSIHNSSLPLTPGEVLNEIMNLAHYPKHIAQEFGITIAELQTYLNTPEFQNYLQLVLTINRLRTQIIAAENSSHALTTLSNLTDSGKPEVVRRAANTILTIAGALPPKSPISQKSWDNIALTKQHMPTYSNSPTTLKPATTGGAGPVAPIPTEPSPPNNSAFGGGGNSPKNHRPAALAASVLQAATSLPPPNRSVALIS